GQDVLAWGKRFAQREAVNGWRNLPPFERHGLAALFHLLAKNGLNRLQLPLVALDRGAHQLDFRPGLSRPAALHDRAGVIRVGRRFAQVKLQMRVRHANLGVAPRNLYVSLARHNRNRRKHLLEELLLVRADTGTGLLQWRDALSVDQEHPLARRQEHPRRYFYARVNVHDRVDPIGFFLDVDLFGERLLCAFFGRGGFRRSIPIHHRCGNLFPGASLDAVIAHTVPVAFVAAHQLVATVLQHELTAPRKDVFVFLGLAFILGSLIWDRALRHRRLGRGWPSIARIGRLDPRRIDFGSFNESGWLGLEGGAGWPFRREVAPRRHVSGERPCPKHAQGCCKSDGTDSHKESLGGAMHLSGRGLPLEAE